MNSTTGSDWRCRGKNTDIRSVTSWCRPVRSRVTGPASRPDGTTAIHDPFEDGDALSPGLLPLVVLALFAGGHSPSREITSGGESTRSSACPAWFEDAHPIGPGRPGAVPLADLESVVVCRYFGNPESANGPGLPANNHFAAQRSITRTSRAISLALAFDRLRPYPSRGKGTLICPAEFGGGFYLLFRYSDHRQASVEVVPSGCPRVVPGRHGSWRLLSGPLRVRLKHLVPLPPAEPGDG